MRPSEPTLKLSVRPQVAYECIDGEVIILNLESGMYHALNETASRIWMKVVEDQAFENIFVDLQNAHGLSREEAGAMVARLIGEVEEQDLVEIQEPRPAWITQNATAAREKDSARLWPVIETYSDMRAALVLDPVHEVDDTGWPRPKKPESRAPEE